MSRLKQARPQTKLRSHVTRLDELVRRTGGLVVSRALADGVRAVRDRLENGAIHVEVELSERLSEQEMERFAHWMDVGRGWSWSEPGSPSETKVPLAGRDVEVVLSTRARSSSRERRPDAVPAHLLVLVCRSAELATLAGDTVRGCPYVVLALLDGVGKAALDSAPDALYVQPVELEATSSVTTLSELLRTLDRGGVLEILDGRTMVTALQTLLELTGIGLDDDARAMRVRKAAAQSRLNKLQTRRVEDVRSVTSSVRTRLSKLFGELERSVDERLQSATVATGSFAIEIETRIQSVVELDRQDLAKSTVLRLPDASRQELLDALRAHLTDLLEGDLTAIRDVFGVARREILASLESASGPPVVPHFDYITSERIYELVDTHLLFQREYRGETPRRGVMEYLMVARRYQMMFFMLFSAFGLSFVRSYRDLMLPLAIVLLSFGGLQVSETARRERIESTERELEKLREHLRGELRRIVSEARRSWQSLVTKHLSDQLGQTVETLEHVLSEHVARTSEEEREERQRLQRQLQAIENRSSQLSSAAADRAKLVNDLASFEGELAEAGRSAFRASREAP